MSKSFTGDKNYRKTSFVSLNESIVLLKKTKPKQTLKEVSRAWAAR